MLRFDLIWRCAIVVLIVECGMVVNFKVARRTPSIAAAFLAHQVVPDVVPKAPKCTLKVEYPSGVRVNKGNELTPTQVRDLPCVSWNTCPNEYFTLALVDPDAPSRSNPTIAQFKHWLVGNIRGCNVASGDTLAEYIGAAPPLNTGLHRYVFLLYRQPGKIKFDEPKLSNRSQTGRTNFKIAKFAAKYNLKNPVAGNFFQAQYDDYVPILNKQLSGA